MGFSPSARRVLIGTLLLAAPVGCALPAEQALPSEGMDGGAGFDDIPLDGGPEDAGAVLPTETDFLGAPIDDIPPIAEDRTTASSADERDGSYLLMTGDFTGDRQDDILLYAPQGGNTQLLQATGEHRFEWKDLGDVQGIYQPLSGDFDGNGVDDIFWYANYSGKDSVWYGDGGGAFAGVTHDVLGKYKPFVGDFDGDQIDDIFWYAAGSDADHLWFGQPDRTFRREKPPNVNGLYVPLAGDFNGDGFDDIFWYGPGALHDSLWNGTAAGIFVPGQEQSVQGTYAPVVGDFNADGRSDILWYAAGNAADYLWYGGPQGFLPQTENLPQNDQGDFFRPHVGDFDGNGSDDVLWFRPGNGQDALWPGERFQDGVSVAQPPQLKHLSFLCQFFADWHWPGKNSGITRRVECGSGCIKGSKEQSKICFSGKDGGKWLWWDTSSCQNQRNVCGPEFAWPVAGQITSKFGQRNGRLHAGLDIGAPIGRSVVASKAGTVRFAGWNGGYGLSVEIDHGGGVWTRYAHLSSVSVKAGKGVGQSQHIGAIGSTGSSTGPHLHFEIRVGSSPKDPLGYL
ncbi:MAG: peptidoglycan DD-metalloendopeptidase family protein [Myxococcales bacterium]|nr:peptidoglycan DD-metalloendopeptidase family protein [Myxococcales bacterium]